MPATGDYRYFLGRFSHAALRFHLTDGKQVLNNHKGVDLSGNAAAREDAAAMARDLEHGGSCRAGTGPAGSSPSWISTETRSTRYRSPM